MVGDWDVRAVSELFSYLPSVREANTIKLVTPLYSPEGAHKGLKGRDKQSDELAQEEFLRHFCNDVEEELRDSNAIVIASPDVNPITEYLLHKIYQVKDCEPFLKCNNPRFDGYIAVKSLRKVEPQEASNLVRLFYREVIIEDNEEIPRRGFIFHNGSSDGDKFLEAYMSQDDIKEETSFHLLGHLVVARYPKDSKTMVVLLNGVSGPATLALAQILTGGGLDASAGMKSQSEKMLKIINQKLDEPNSIGFEAIIDVQITKSKSSSYLTYVDTRKVDNWNFTERTKPRTLQDFG